MFDEISTAAAVFIVLASLLHVLIFAMESLFWSRPAVHGRFGVTDSQAAEILRPMAYNQGWYNLFLAIGAVLGLVLSGSSDAATSAAGTGMAWLAIGSMLAAALVLVASNRAMFRAAAIQGTLPLVALVLLALS